RVVMHVVGREVVRVLGLEYPAQEIHGLVERIDAGSWVRVRPKRVNHLIARRGETRPGDEKADQRQNLLPHLRRGHWPVVHVDGYSALVLYEDTRSNLAGKRVPDLRVDAAASVQLDGRSQRSNVFSRPDLFEERGRARNLTVGRSEI